jgi:hypothetical protein
MRVSSSKSDKLSSFFLVKSKTERNPTCGLKTRENRCNKSKFRILHLEAGRASECLSIWKSFPKINGNEHQHFSMFSFPCRSRKATRARHFVKLSGTLN